MQGQMLRPLKFEVENEHMIADQHDAAELADGACEGEPGPAQQRRVQGGQDHAAECRPAP